MVEPVYQFIFLIIILLLFYCLVRLYQQREKSLPEMIPPPMKTNEQVEAVPENLTQPINSEMDNLAFSQVPTLTTDQCWKSRYFECPVANGSYLQCTNNYIPKPSQYNADCGNRTFEMTPYPWKISEDAYYNKIGFDREKEFGKVRFV